MKWKKKKNRRSRIRHKQSLYKKDGYSSYSGSITALTIPPFPPSPPSPSWRQKDLDVMTSCIVLIGYSPVTDKSWVSGLMSQLIKSGFSKQATFFYSVGPKTVYRGHKAETTAIAPWWLSSCIKGWCRVSGRYFWRTTETAGFYNIYSVSPI